VRVRAKARKLAAELEAMEGTERDYEAKRAELNRLAFALPDDAGLADAMNGRR
jgi:hypothetical protein